MKNIQEKLGLENSNESLPRVGKRKKGILPYVIVATLGITLAGFCIRAYQSDVEKWENQQIERYYDRISEEGRSF